MCNLGAGGLEKGYEEDVGYEEFKYQISRWEGGWYKTNVTWKQPDKPLNSSKNLSISRLKSLLRPLKKILSCWILMATSYKSN